MEVSLHVKGIREFLDIILVGILYPKRTLLDTLLDCPANMS